MGSLKSTCGNFYWLSITRSSVVAETARRFMSLDILLRHSRSFEMTMLSRACVSPYQYSIETMSVSRTVSEIFSVKEWSDLETGPRSLNGAVR